MKIMAAIKGRLAGRKPWRLRDQVTVSIEPEELLGYLNKNDGVQKQFPLAVALQLSDAMDAKTMEKSVRMDALDMSFARGYRAALRDFGLAFTGAMSARPKAMPE